MKTIDEVLSATINSEADAKAYLKDLYDNGYAYHTDDDAFDIGLFTEAQAVIANDLMDQVRFYLHDPCAYLIELDPNE